MLFLRYVKCITTKTENQYFFNKGDKLIATKIIMDFVVKMIRIF